MTRKPPAILYTSFANTYVELGEWHVSRYDFTDESAPIWLCNIRENVATPIHYRELHKLQRYVWDLLDLSDDETAAMSDIVSDFEHTCRALQIEYHGDAEADEAEREAQWCREHEQGLCASSRYI